MGTNQWCEAGANTAMIPRDGSGVRDRGLIIMGA